MSYIKPFLLTLVLFFAHIPFMAINAHNADVVMPDINTSKNDVMALPEDVQMLKVMAFKYINTAMYDKAMECGQRLVEIGREKGDVEFAELYGHIAIGVAAACIGEPSVSYLNLEDAKAIAERSENHEALCSIYNAFGIYYTDIYNDYYAALSYYYKAVDEARACGDRNRYAILLSNISEVYLMREDMSGLSIAEESNDIARRINENIPLYYSSANLASFYLLEDDVESAEPHIITCERIYSAEGIGSRADVLLLRVEHARRSGDMTGAFDYMKELYSLINSEAISRSTVNKIYYAYGKLLRETGRLDESSEMLLEGLHAARTNSTIFYVPNIMKELTLTLRERGRHSKALDYSLMYQQFQDSMIVVGREQALQEARIRNDIASREVEIDRQKIELLKNRNKIYMLVSALVFVLALLGITYYFYRKKETLYTAIVKQNKEYVRRETLLLDQLERERMAAKEPDTASEAKVAEAPHQSTANPASPLASEKVKELMEKFTILMLEKKLFSDPNLTVASVAEMLATNRTYLSKAINESTGNTFTQVVNDYRIREAIRLISDFDANIPLKQIANDVGFNSMSTFYVTFQAQTGMTPARYRSKLKDN